jgi:predicted enzyme related to lactoylglutathione lyase
MPDAFERLYDPTPIENPGPAFAEALRSELRAALYQARRTQMDTEPTFRTGKICYIEIPAADIAASAAFYSRAFGWRIRQRGDGSTAFDDTVNEVSGSWVLDRAPASVPGLTVHIMVADINAAIAAVEAAGGTIVQPVDENHPEVYALFRDIAGNVLGIYQQPGLAEAEAALER